MCHLAVEKILKAKVQEVTGAMPPRTHNLRYLVRLSGLELPDEIVLFLSQLSEVSVPTRYPDDFDSLLESFDEDTARSYMDRTEEVFRWIRDSIES